MISNDRGDTVTNQPPGATPPPARFESDLIVQVADAFELRVERVSREIVSRSRNEIQGWSEIDSPEVWELITAITDQLRRGTAESLRKGFELPATCPRPAQEAAVLAARAQISLHASLKAFRLGHRLAWDAWLQAFKDVGVSTSDELGPGAAITRFVLDYEDRIADLFTDAYLDAAEAQRRSGKPELEWIRAILDGSSSAHRSELYALDQLHQGVIVWGGSGERTLVRLALTCDALPLTLRVTGDTWWGWLGRNSERGPISESKLLEFQPPSGVRLSLGSPAEGIEGFRTTHRQAGEARRVAQLTKTAVTTFSGVALEAMALKDRRAARELVAEVLGVLDGEDSKAEEKRTTLGAYFSCAQNAASTASVLGVHEHTVGRRIRTVEALLGHAINDRRPELELALRLRPLLAAEANEHS